MDCITSMKGDEMTLEQNNIILNEQLRVANNINTIYEEAILAMFNTEKIREFYKKYFKEDIPTTVQSSLTVTFVNRLIDARRLRG